MYEGLEKDYYWFALGGDGYLVNDGGDGGYGSRVQLWSKPSGRLPINVPENRYLTLRIQKSVEAVTAPEESQCEAAIYLDLEAIEKLIAHLTAARDHLAAYGNWENC